MGINVSVLDSNYDFEVNTASYAGAPTDSSVMFVSAKVAKLIENLENARNCLVFAEETIEVPESLRENNCFIMVKNPQFAYAEFVQKLADEIESKNRARKFTLTEGGYYIGENVTIGKNPYIEPTCLIGHDVVIGDNCKILAGAKIKNAVIGDNFIANENCAIGVSGYTMATDEAGNKIQMPTLGKVIIGNNVYIGGMDNIAVGSGGNTVIEDNAKIDSLVHVGHDIYVRKNAELVTGTILGGFSDIGENSFLGMNVTIKNRVVIGSNAVIGMGAVVTKNVEPGTVMVGNPARPLERK